MVIMNDNMWNSLDSQKWSSISSLFPVQTPEKVDCQKAKEFVSNLLCFSDGVLFLNFHGCQKYNPNTEIDATGFEGSLNSAHMCDLFTLTPENAMSCVHQYIKLIKESSREMGVEGKIAFLIGFNEGFHEDDEHYDVWVDFHRYREGEHYMADDLDGFENNIMILVI